MNLQTHPSTFKCQPYLAPKRGIRAGFGFPFRGRKGLRPGAAQKTLATINRNLTLGITLLFLMLVVAGNGQNVAQTRCDNFKKGVNLSNWLEAYWNPNWPDTVTYPHSFFVEMKNAGLTSFRLPVCFALVTDTAPPYYVDTTNRVFRIIDSVIQWTTELNMNLIIDNHHDWNITDTTWRIERPRLEHLWSVLANRYKNLDPNRYFFEILNEPSYISNDSLALIFDPVIDTIRQYAPGHSIVVSPNAWSAGIGYQGYQPLSDTNLIYTFHSYDPYPFTHQGLTFVVPRLPTGVPFPNTEYNGLVVANWEFALLWRDSHHLPLFLGEFGVGDSADAVSRCNWIDTMANRINGSGTSAFYWDVIGDFKMYHSGVVTQDSIMPCFRRALGLYGDTLTSVQYLANDIDLKIYPNPAQSVLTIQSATNLPNARFTIMNEIGAVMQTGYLHQTITDINLNSVANGIYFLEITYGTYGGSRVNRKFVVNK